MNKNILCLTLILLALHVQSQFLTINSQEHVNEFNEYLQKFGKQYPSKEEYEYRMQIYFKNKKAMFNNQINDPSSNYGISKFADMTQEEFEQQFLKLNRNKLEIIQQQEEQNLWFWPFNSEEEDDGTPVPDHFDWREKGVVTPAKEQGTCGSCWTFATTGILEGQHAIKYGELLNLSEQMLLDCDTINQGCKGGLMTDAFEWMRWYEVALETTQDYGEYKFYQEKCHHVKEKGRVRVKSYQQLSQNEEQMKRTIYKKGPIAAGMNARFLQFYDGGIHNAPQCNDDINHAILIVGYGEENGVPYWIIKNQWGPSWGDKGFFRLVRGQKRCGIHTYVTTVEIL